jgi:hypothetical protein
LTIVTVQFDYDGQDRYKMLFDVFKYSLKKNFPAAKLHEINIQPNNNWSRETVKRGFHSNKIKLDAWCKAMEEIDDEKIIFMDCDMIVLDDLSSAFDSEFDIGITARTRCRMPFNGGVVFVRNTESSRNFIKLWGEIDDRMYRDKKFHNPYRVIYAGINQAAFGYLYEHPDLHTAKMKEFPCAIWNACCEDRYNDKMKVIHIKSQVRKACFSNYPTDAIEIDYRGQVEKWREYAIAAGIYNKTRETKDAEKIKKKRAVMMVRPKRKVLR